MSIVLSGHHPRRTRQRVLLVAGGVGITPMRALFESIPVAPGQDRGLLSPWSLVRLVPDLRDRDVYLCGPPGMAEAVRTSLFAAGLPEAHLHEERFAF